MKIFGTLDLKTLFHEYGHCLHNILSNHDFQFISNQFRIDYAEFIALLSEKFFDDFLFNSNDNSKNNLKKAVKFYDELSQIEQIYYSLIDLKFHTLNNITKENLLEINNELCRKILNIKISNSFFNNNSHLAFYPGVYFSYPLGHFLARNINKKSDFKMLLKNGHNKNVFSKILKIVNHKII